MVSGAFLFKRWEKKKHSCLCKHPALAPEGDAHDGDDRREGDGPQQGVVGSAAVDHQVIRFAALEPRHRHRVGVCDEEKELEKVELASSLRPSCMTLLRRALALCKLVFACFFSRYRSRHPRVRSTLSQRRDASRPSSSTMPAHNNQIPNAHFKKDWQGNAGTGSKNGHVRTWFNQPGRKKSRRIAREKKAKAIFPRPTAGALRPIVRPQTQRYNFKTRLGRGFTLEELKVRFIRLRRRGTGGGDDTK